MEISSQYLLMNFHEPSPLPFIPGLSRFQLAETWLGSHNKPTLLV